MKTCRLYAKHSLLTACLILISTTFCQAGVYFVATDGSDYNKGTFESPFASVQKAASVMSAGDTCFIREGVYHQENVINSLKGTSSARIVFTNYNGEKVVFDGTQALSELGSKKWIFHKGDIYKTMIEEDIWQLFDDGEMMINARWPNAFLHDNTIFQRNANWAKGNDKESENGLLVDDAIDQERSLVASGLDLTGAIGIMNCRSFKTYPCLITKHSAGDSTFEYNEAPSYLGEQWYYTECKLDLLDASREWFFDKNSKTVYLWTADGKIPSGNIRGKTQSYALLLDNCENVVIDGLNFYATTIQMTASSSCELKNCNLDYPSFSKRMLGCEDDIEITRLLSPGDNSPGNSVINCKFENSDGTAVHLSGNSVVVENNYFHNIDFSCAGLPGLGVGLLLENGSGAIVRQNTIENFGASSFCSPSDAATIEYNRAFSYPGTTLQNDGAVFHRMVTQQTNSISRYNWIHDTIKYTIRFDGDPAGLKGLVHHNVCWKAGSMRLKGDQHQAYNNVGFEGNSEKRRDISISTDKFYGYANPNNDKDISTDSTLGWSIARGRRGSLPYHGNANSITKNNVAGITPDPVPGTATNNYNIDGKSKTQHDLLRDIDNLDFRPRKDAVELIDKGAVIPDVTNDHLGAAPDIGAYEYGAKDYWIPGRKLPQASTPIPPDGSKTVKPDADLMWLEGYVATSHILYFGANSSAVLNATESSPEHKGAQEHNIFTPGSLRMGQEYFWRVDAISTSGVKRGKIWSFTVKDNQ